MSPEGEALYERDLASRYGLPIELPAIFSPFQKFMPPTQLPGLRIELVFAESYASNASSTKSGSVGVVVLARGLAFALSDTFRRIMRHPELQLGWGNAALEAAPAEVRVPPHIRYPFPDDADFPEAEWGTPVDPLRRFCANVLTTMAIHFVIMHEVAHIANGHIDYIRERQRCGPPMDLDTRHVIESDADAFAVRCGIKWAAERWRVPVLRDDPFRVLFPTVEDALAAWSFAVGMDLNVRYGPTFSDKLDMSEKHPPPALRHKTALGVATMGYQEWVPEVDSKRGWQALTATIADVARAYARISGTKANAKALRAAIEDTTFTPRMNATWTKIYPDLKRLAANPHLVEPEPGLSVGKRGS